MVVFMLLDYRSSRLQWRSVVLYLYLLRASFKSGDGGVSYWSILWGLFYLKNGGIGHFNTLVWLLL